VVVGVKVGLEIVFFFTLMHFLHFGHFCITKNIIISFEMKNMQLDGGTSIWYMFVYNKMRSNKMDTF
jgi:hypothetical protein